MTMAYETIIYEKKAPVATITLNRPEALNAISQQMTAELHRALDEADADREVRAIILTGAGRGFSAGYDIARRPDGRAPLDGTGVDHAEFMRDWWARDAASAQRLIHLWHLTTPVIAAVHGWVMGGGFWYSLAADITIAADNAVFAQPEVRHTSNTTILFAALAGWKAAHRYGLTGDHLDAAEALRLGLVNEVVPQAELLPKARALAERIARVPEPSVRLNKAITCYGLLAMGLGAGLLMNVPFSAMAHASYDDQRGHLLELMRTGGLKAFLESRDGGFRPEPFGPKSKPGGA
jgi:enoyl-CoA hydratase/carnithine racemase